MSKTECANICLFRPSIIMNAVKWIFCLEHFALAAGMDENYFDETEEFFLMLRSICALNPISSLKFNDSLRTI